MEFSLKFFLIFHRIINANREILEFGEEHCALYHEIMILFFDIFDNVDLPQLLVKEYVKKIKIV